MPYVFLPMPDPAPPDAASFINEMHAGTWAGGLGLHVLTATRDQVVAELEVRPAHLQPQGIVHGGVHASVIESLCSVGAALDAMTHGRTVVGLENSTSFVRAARQGTLRATATPITRGAGRRSGRRRSGTGRARWWRRDACGSWCWSPRRTWQGRS